jgi:WD40 repeat protein
MRYDFASAEFDSMPRPDRARRRVSSGWTRISLVSWEFRLIAIVLPTLAALMWSNSRGSRSSAGNGVALKGHRGLVEAVAFSPDGRTLASCGFDQTVRLWDATRLGDEQPANPEVLSHPSVIFAVAFSPDGSRLAAAGDRFVTIWSRDPSYQPEVERSGETYHSLAFSSDGRTLALAAEDGTVRLWEVPAGRERSTVRGHSGAVRSVAFSPDGKLMASAGQDGRVVLWDATGFNAIRVLIEHGSTPVRMVAFSPDSRTLAVADPAYKDKDILLFDTESGAIRTRLSGYPLGINAVTFSPDGRTLATAGVDHSLKLWDIETAKQLHCQIDEHWLKSVAFSPDGRWLAYVGGDENVRLLRVHGSPPARVDIPRATPPEDRKTT